MSLPKIAHLSYPIEFKSINKKTSFRPFTVKEEKVLLHMKGNTDPAFLQHSLVQLIKNCVLDTINIEKLCMYDIEWFIVNIRSKSVSEIVEINYTDPATGKTQKATINLDNAEVVFPKERENIIPITDTVGLTLKDPSFADMMEVSVNPSVDKLDAIWKVVLASVESIYDGDKVNVVGVDCTVEELDEFLEEIPTAISAKLYNFFNTLPHVEVTAELEDGTSVKLQGMMSFLVS